MQITPQQVSNWFIQHGISVNDFTDHLELIAYDPTIKWSVLVRLVLNEEAPTDEARHARFLKGAAQMAWELAIVPPQVATNLNHQSFR